MGRSSGKIGQLRMPRPSGISFQLVIVFEKPHRLEAFATVANRPQDHLPYRVGLLHVLQAMIYGGL
jgi:hypothetical protein